MPITAEQAWDATDPSQPEEARKLSAANMMAGVAANDAYIASRGELEQLVLQSRGGQIVSHAAINTPEVEEGPTASVLQTADAEGWATEDSSGNTGSLTSGENDTDNEDLAKLRKQLEDAGLTPEA
jgi:hypothetical protein